MSAISKATAIQTGLERIVYALRQELATEITALDTTTDGLDAPPDAAYYLAASDEDVRETLHIHSPAVWVLQSDRATPVRRRSGSGVTDGEQLRWPATVIVLFRAPGAYSAADITGHSQTLREYTEYAAKIYEGAVLNTVVKHAPIASAIHQVVELGSIADTTTTLAQYGLALVGRARVDFEITQDVTYPAPAYTLGAEP